MQTGVCAAKQQPPLNPLALSVQPCSVAPG
jgi:hypothetical protein